MIGTAFEVYREVDPDKKTAKWADAAITIYRRDWRPLVNQLRAQANKRYLLSEQSMKSIKDSFKDKDFIKSTEFNPLGIMETMKNTLVEEITKMPPRAELRAVDPSAINDSKSDVELLKNRNIIQEDLSKYQQQVGLPAYKIDYSKFKGNVEDFDKMGLDESDPDDINFYERNWQRMNYQIAGQAVINNVMKLNRFDEERIEDFVIDILAYKAICMQSYVDKITGEIKQKYIYPETAYGIFGDSNDGADDICRGWQDNVTVMEWLQMVGDEFDWEKDWWQLLWAINYANGYKFTGFIRNNVQYDCCANPTWMSQMGLEGQPANFCEWTLAYTYKLYAGYIEWNTVEATATYLKKHGDPAYLAHIPYSYDLKKKKQVKEYYKESYYQQQWYSSYFLATTSISQWIYGFGKVYYQQFQGANDEYASGTLTYYRKKGRSAVEIAVPYIEMANFAFYRMLWVIHHSKPAEDEVVIEELISIAKGLQRLYPQMGGTNSVPAIDSILQQTIQYQRENFVRLRSFPQIDGRTVGQLPPLEGKRNGVDPIAATLQAVVMWAESQIAAKIGINPMRFGANPPSRESTKSEMNTLQSSYNSTGYVYRMIQFLKEHQATTALNYAIDIIKFKESIPYNWLKTCVGNEAFGALGTLDNFASYRWGIFVRDYNIEMDKQRIMQAADIALQKGQLEYDQWFVITQTEDFKKANEVLSYLKLKQAKKQRKQELQNYQIQDQMAQKEFERQKELEMTKGQLAIKKAEIEAQGFIAAAQVQANSRVEVKKMTVESEPNKQAAKSENQKEVAQTKEDLKRQKPYPAQATEAA